jgi:hypothetical protein
MTVTTVHDPDVSGDLSNEAPITIPLPRTAAGDWPGEGEVAFVPASLILAAHGRCSCPNCIDGFVHMMRRTRLRTV